MACCVHTFGKWTSTARICFDGRFSVHIGCIYSTSTRDLGGFSAVFWSIPSIIISSAAIGAATGLINGIGNLGGFVGPYLFGYLIDSTGSTKVGLFFIVGVQLLAGILLATLRNPKLKAAQLEIQQKNKDRMKNEGVSK